MLTKFFIVTRVLGGGLEISIEIQGTQCHTGLKVAPIIADQWADFMTYCMLSSSWTTVQIWLQKKIFFLIW